MQQTVKMRHHSAKMSLCHHLYFIFVIIVMQTLWLCVCINFWGVCVTLGNIYQEYYQCLCPHVDPHLSPPNALWWVSMCIRLSCIHIDHLEVFSRDRNGIVNAPEGFLCYFNEGPSPTVYRPILDSH